MVNTASLGFICLISEKGLVGYYPLNNVTEGNDMSGYNNHGTLHDVTYEDGPLDNPGGSARMSGSQNSYIEVCENIIVVRFEWIRSIRFAAFV